MKIYYVKDNSVLKGKWILTHSKSFFFCPDSLLIFLLSYINTPSNNFDSYIFSTTASNCRLYLPKTRLHPNSHSHQILFSFWRFCLFVFSFPYLLVFLVFLLPVQFTLVWSLNYPYFSCMFSIFLVFIFLLINSIPHHSITPFSLFNSCSLNCKPDFSFSCISFLLESKIWKPIRLALNNFFYFLPTQLFTNWS